MYKKLFSCRKYWKHGSEIQAYHALSASTVPPTVNGRVHADHSSSNSSCMTLFFEIFTFYRWRQPLGLPLIGIYWDILLCLNMTVEVEFNWLTLMMTGQIALFCALHYLQSTCWLNMIKVYFISCLVVMMPKVMVFRQRYLSPHHLLSALWSELEL